MRQILPESARASLTTPLHKRKPHIKIILKKAGHDAPHPPEAKQILRKTCKIVPAGSEIENVLRDSQNLQLRNGDEDFAGYVQSALDEIEKKGLTIFFFTMKGFSSYRFVHCANQTHYGQCPEEFYKVLDEFADANPNMFYQPETYRPVADRDELMRIVEKFEDQDIQTFKNVMASILAKAPHYRAIDFVGHDRTVSLEETSSRPPEI
jgi:hypothetical protein